MPCRLTCALKRACLSVICVCAISSIKTTPASARGGRGKGNLPLGTGMPSMQRDEAHTVLEMARAERARLQRAVDKLRESNAILKAELEKEFDPDYKQALQENIPVIAKYLARVAYLDSEISELEAGRQHLGSTEAAVPLEDSGAGAPGPATHPAGAVEM